MWKDTGEESVMSEMNAGKGKRVRGPVCFIPRMELGKRQGWPMRGQIDKPR